MAITDVAPKAQSVIRTAMDRASDAVRGRRDEAPMVLDTALERRPIRRRDAKLALKQYLEANFRQRTQEDGTVLAPSLELLMEQLTNLVMDLDLRATEPVPSAGPKKPTEPAAPPEE